MCVLLCVHACTNVWKCIRLEVKFMEQEILLYYKRLSKGTLFYFLNFYLDIV